MRQQIKSLMLGNGLAQALQFSSILILSRIYEPSDFGLLAQVQSVAMIGAIWVTLQLHLTIPLQKTIEEAKQAIRVIEKIAFSLFLIATFPALIVGDPLIYSVILSLFLGLANTYNGYLVYGGQFERLSSFYVVRAVLIIALQISLSILNMKNGLVVATLTGELFAAVYLRVKRVGGLDNGATSWSQVVSYIKNNSTFAIYGSMQETVSVAAFFLPLFLFSYRFGEDVGGQYAMASRLVWAPIILFVSSYAQVLFHKYAKYPQIGNVEIKLQRMEWVVLAVSLLLAMQLYLFNKITTFLIGEDWNLASLLIPLNIVWGLVFYISTPYRVMIRVLRIQKIQMQADFISLILLLVAVWIFNLSPIELMIAVVIIAIFQNMYLAKMVNLRLGRNEGH